MVLFLIVDVTADFFQLFLPQADNPVTILPGQLEFRCKLVVHAIRRGAFNLSDEIRDDDGRWQSQQQVNVIGHRILPDRHAAALADLLAQYRKHLGAPAAIDQRIAGVRGPSYVKVELMEYVSHLCATFRRRFSRCKPPEGGCFRFAFLNPALKGWAT